MGRVMRQVTGRQFFTALDAHGIAPGDRSSVALGGDRHCFYPEQGEPVGKRIMSPNDPRAGSVEFRYFLYEDTDHD